MITLDTDAESEIDSGYDKTVTMSKAGDMQSFSAQAESFENGKVNKYTFSIQANIPVKKGDKLSFQLPYEVIAPVDDSVMNCKGITNLKTLDCKVQGQVITITFLEFTNPSGAFTWEISGIKNPFSTKTSGSFTNVKFSDSEDYKVSELNSADISPITNKYPA